MISTTDAIGKYMGVAIISGHLESLCPVRNEKEYTCSNSSKYINMYSYPNFTYYFLTVVKK